MISSSFYKLLTIFSFLIAITTAGMERVPNKDLPASPSMALPSSSSRMAFPAPKKDAGKSGGSMIERTIRRTASLLSLNNRSVSEELPESLSSASPRTSSPITNEELKRSSKDAAQIKKEFTYRKPLYTITYGQTEEVISIDGPCTTQYQVASLKEFKKDSAFLRRVEILELVNRILVGSGKEKIELVSHAMGTNDATYCAKKAHERIKRYHKTIANFTASFYVVRLVSTQQRVCVFESEIKEITGSRAL